MTPTLAEQWSVEELANRAKVHVWNIYDAEAQSIIDSPLFVYEIYRISNALGATLEIKLVEDE